jgi:hypothetical protein
MVTYRVEVDGVEEWSDTSDEYLGVHFYPHEYLRRPTSGSIKLFVNDELISNAVPEGTE